MNLGQRYGETLLEPGEADSLIPNKLLTSWPVVSH